MIPGPPWWFYFLAPMTPGQTRNKSRVTLNARSNSPTIPAGAITELFRISLIARNCQEALLDRNHSGVADRPASGDLCGAMGVHAPAALSRQTPFPCRTCPLGPPLSAHHSLLRIR